MNYTNHHVVKSEASDEEELLQAQAHIWNHTFSFINSMSLKCAIELGIPDIIHNHGKPMTLSQLMDALKLDSAKAPGMHRLMRMLIHSGFFLTTKMAENDEKEEEEAYILTPASMLLLKSHLASVSPFVLGQLHQILTAPWHHLGDWFRSNDLNPFVTTHGRKISDILSRDPMFNQCFHEIMASDCQLVSRLIVGNSNNKKVLEGLSSLVDVGGGTGILAKAIAVAFPKMNCTVLDLPHVVQGLKGTENLSYVEGNMFKSIPPADAVLLKWIMHNWSDEECVEILKKCKEAIPSKENGGKVIIIEMVLDDQNNDYIATQTQLYFDMLMLTSLTGRQRTESDWSKLFSLAGFSGYKINPILGLRSMIEWIMHNWSDEECVEILKKYKEAIPSKEKGGKVNIVEMILGDQNNNYGATQTQLYFDMVMLIVLAGRERTENDLSKLFSQAGFSGYKIIPMLGLRSIIEVY